MAKDSNLPISPEYAGYLTEHFDAGLVDQLVNNRHYADLPDQPGQQIPYVVVNGPNTVDMPKYFRRVVYFPGYTEGIANKAPFILALAEQGLEVIAPGQNRRKILKDSLSQKNATYSQARNMQAVIDAVAVDNDETFEVVTHSYGFPIFKRVVETIPHRFQANKAVVCAPAEVNLDESVSQLGQRFVDHFRSEPKTAKEIHDFDKQMMKAGSKTMMANIPRSIREALEMSHDVVHFGALSMAGLRKIVVLGFAQDHLFPHEVLERHMAMAIELPGVSYAQPLSLTEMHNSGWWAGGEGASHNDDQFNPRRVAQAVAQIYKTA